MTNETNPPILDSKISDPYIDDNGVWISKHPLALPAYQSPAPALFLDRDGVINVDVNYLSRIEDVVLHEGAAGMIAAANNAGIPVIVITNQSGVGRGYFDWAVLEDIQSEIARQLQIEGAHWDAVYACPFHKEGKPPYNHDNHPFRKPNSGMLTLAADQFNLDLSASWVIGDKADDVKAGINAGLCGGIHVGTRFKEAQIERQKASDLRAPNFTVMTFSTVQEACNALPLLKV